MGPARLRVRAAASLLAVATCVLGGVSQADSAAHKPSVISGSGTNLGGLFTASSAGAVFELPTRARLALAPHTTLRVFPVPQSLQLAPGAKTTTWSFALQSGRVDVDLPKDGRTAVLASIGKLSAVITGGHVAILADSATTVDNVEGEVRTLLSDHWQSVPVGSVATLSRDNPSATAKPALPGPTLNGGQRTFFAPGEVVGMRGFHWTSVPGADHYDVRLRRLADGKVVDQRSASGNDLASELSPVEPGKYGFTLRSVDARGVEGGWSPEVELRVIGVVLPPGGYSNDDAIYLGVGQHVQFTNTSGLEMTYVGAGRYFPAASGATLYRNSTTLIGFRIPGSTETATARLEPREIYADVQIGPMRAIWPHDPISIDIRLKSRKGAEIPAFLRAVPTVTLGLDTIAPSFVQRGNTLHAVVLPSGKPGPWVLRVDVADQFGVPLGHEFLEVAGELRRDGPRVRIVRAPTHTASTARVPAADSIIVSSN
jgi:hypothetical protein